MCLLPVATTFKTVLAVSQVLDKNAIKHIVYCALLFSISYFIYENSLEGSFVWDDRAAIVKNPDVIGTSTIETLLNNDFWGQNMQLIDSHKSYRPVTVLSFRYNFASHGMSAYHFHYTNVIIYGVVCVLLYLCSLLWMSTSGARITALLFTLHPVHVEGVASVVGRADSLCALFYLLSIISYTLSVRLSRFGNPLYVLSIVCALASSLSKEVGVTGTSLFVIVFGAFVVIEVLETLRYRVSTIKILTPSGASSGAISAPAAPPTPTRVNRPAAVSTPVSEQKPRFTFEGTPSTSSSNSNNNKTPVKKAAATPAPAPVSASKQVTLLGDLKEKTKSMRVSYRETEAKYSSFKAASPVNLGNNGSSSSFYNSKQNIDRFLEANSGEATEKYLESIGAVVVSDNEEEEGEEVQAV